MSHLNEPHAGALVNRTVAADRASELEGRASGLPRLALDAREASDLALIASGAATPLTGFLGLRDYRSVLERLALADGTPWPVPFTLAATISDVAAILHRSAAALYVGSRLAAVIEVKETFVRSPREEAAALYGSEDPSHPGVAYLLSRPTALVAGDVHVLPGRAATASPHEIRSLARREGWTSLAGLASADGAACIEAAGGAGGALLPAPPITSRHAATRDALLQAIVLKNYGACEVYFDYDRADLRADPRSPSPEDVGITPIWIVSTGRRAAPERPPGGRDHPASRAVAARSGPPSRRAADRAIRA
jgi:ATP sulfurylase